MMTFIQAHLDQCRKQLCDRCSHIGQLPNGGLYQRVRLHFLARKCLRKLKFSKAEFLKNSAACEENAAQGERPHETLMFR
ncbi:MAG: hypothetical protein AAFY25_11210 [Pseudomonadota bacterium]